MSLFSRLLTDGKGSVFDKFALFCALLSVACVLGAHGMDKLAQSGNLPTIAFHQRDKDPGVDYSATASIPRRAQDANLNPCGNK